MWLTNILQLSLLAASLIGASPFEGSGAQTLNAANELVKRADPQPVSCGPSDRQRAWPLQSVQNAYDALVANGNLDDSERPRARDRFYPRMFGGDEASPSDESVKEALNATPGCETGQANMRYYEFPLTSPTFAGGGRNSAGDDRVVAIFQLPEEGGARSFTYCLAITHRGLTRGRFNPCTSA